jgi:hypothetical protein
MAGLVADERRLTVITKLDDKFLATISLDRLSSRDPKRSPAQCDADARHPPAMTNASGAGVD